MTETSERLLIVDDSPQVIQLLHTIMGDLCECVFATSGEAALALSRSSPPSVILLDVEMPSMDGFEVLARLKADPVTADVPVIFVTARVGAEAEVAAIEAGAADFITKPIVAPVARARVAMQLKLYRQTAALAHLASHDGLTGLFNRRHFDRVFADEVSRHHRSRDAMTLAMVDVDFFKAYNDRYGHPQGDMCLRLVAQALAQSVLRPGDVVARYGGEEFALVLPLVGPEQAGLVGERLCTAVRQQQIAHAASPSGIVTISVGIASGIPPGNDPAAILARADAALYSVKEGGRNGARVEALSP